MGLELNWYKNSMLKGPKNEVSPFRQVLYVIDQVASGYLCRPGHIFSGNNGTEIVYPCHPREDMAFEVVGQGQPQSWTPSEVSWLISPVSLCESPYLKK